MKIRLKKFLNKYKNRIVSFIVVSAFVPLFAFNAFAYTSYDNFPYNKDVLTVYVNSNYYTNTKNTDNQYQFSNPSQNTTFISILSLYDDVWNIPVNIEIFDYYLVASVFAQDGGDINFTFFPSRFRVGYNGHSSDELYYYDVSDVNFYHTDTDAYKGFSASCKVDLTPSSAIGFVRFDAPSSLYVPSNIFVEMSVIALPKGLTSGDANQALVSAINNQTSTLGGKIDDTNDFIDKGNDSTGGIVSGNNSAIGELDEVVSEYHATEQQFFDDFNTNQQAITSDIVGWSWGGLVNCANWVGETMTDYYNNMGDFRQYIIYPLMLGIALFFLGRGGSIIGHLFRKPTTTFTHTESRSVMSNGVRHTNTVSTRNGGVFRK